MKKHIRLAIGCIGIMIMSTSLQAQSADSTAQPKPFEASLNLIASYRGDSVVLRWAPETPGAWNEARKAGFIVSRTVLEENGAFDPATFERLTPGPIRPWPLEQWATIAGQDSRDDYAKIAAQALYGKSFTAGAGFVQQADEYATRFSFAMLAADLSANTATALGLRFADKNIEKDRVYIYRVESATDTTLYTVHPGVISVSTAAEEMIPRAVISEVMERENLIELRWNRDFHAPYFSAYYIERSADNGKTFQRLNTLPYVHAVDEKNPATVENITYLDSVQLNYKTYHYRIAGITPFAEVTTPSAPVKAMGRDRTPPPAPQNVAAKHIGGTKVQITWDYPKSKEVRGFLVARADNPTQQFMPLTTDPLPAKARGFTDELADERVGKYYIVAAVDTAGNASMSMTQYAMIIDSIPPAPPTGLAGMVDSTGIVTITWKPGPDPDIKGYYVYFANSADHEFSQVTNALVQDTVYYDTVTIKTLTKKIYYRVVAVDHVSNYSQFSAVLELKRPDVIPPSAAVFDHYKVTENGIELAWTPSSSEDLEETVLYRMDDKKSWKKLASFPANKKQTTYADTTGLEFGRVYSYSLVSVDDSHLTRRSMLMRLRYADLRKGEPVHNLYASPKKEKEEETIFVTWTYPVKGNYRFVLYRAVNGSPFTAHKSLNGATMFYSDSQVRPGNTYEYSVGVVFKDGRKAPFGKVVTATF